MGQLTQYIIALSNLYGMVYKDKVVCHGDRSADIQITIW